MDETYSWLKEAAGFLGIQDPDETLVQQAAPLADWIRTSCPMKYQLFSCSLVRNAGGMYLPELDMVLPGTLASQMLGDSCRLLIVAATLGFSFDKELARLSHVSMADALMLDALGSAWLERSLDALEPQLQARFAPLYMTDRFSCGYGDLPLTLQKELAEKLGLAARPGIIVTDSCMMNPAKSVTAFLGLSRLPQPSRIRGCSVCQMKDCCGLHKKGKACYENK